MGNCHRNICQVNLDPFFLVLQIFGRAQKKTKKVHPKRKKENMILRDYDFVGCTKKIQQTSLGERQTRLSFPPYPPPVAIAITESKPLIEMLEQGVKNAERQVFVVVVVVVVVGFLV